MINLAEIPPPSKLRKSAKPKISLISKLAHACAQVEMIEKKGMNPQFGDYLRACDVFRALRGHLFAANVLIVPDDGFAEWADVIVPAKSPDEADKQLRECTLHTKFIVEDGDSGEKREYKAIGIARLQDEKALYAAKTGAMKFFLKGLGLIVDEEADPEYDAAALAPKAFVGKILDMRKTMLTVQPAEGEPVKIKVDEEATRNRLFTNRGEDVRAECQLQCNKYGKQYWLLRDVLIGKFQVAIANQPDLEGVLVASAEQAHLIQGMKKTAAQAELSEADLLRHIAETYQVDDVKKLTAKELADITDWIFEQGKKPQPIVSILDAPNADEVGAD